ncbi:MAG: hypothetical protein ABIE07_12015 [Candidatus Zixiibacteriota bacterium]
MDIFKSIEKAGKLAIESKRMDLHEELLDVRKEFNEIQDKNLKLIEENNSLKEKLEIQANVIFENGLCWLEGDSNTKEDKALLCSNCYQSDGKIMRLSIKPRKNGRVSAQCTECKNHYVLNEGKPFSGFEVDPYGG